MKPLYTRQADKQFFLLCLIVLGCLIACSILDYFTPIGWAVGLFEFFAGVLPLYFLWSRGTFRRSRLGKWLYVAIAVAAVGALMVIQHWANARLVLFLGLAIVVATYALWYTQKNAKRLADHLKMVFVLSHVSAYVFRINHYEGTFALQLVAFVLLWTAFLSFYFERRKTHLPVDIPKYDFSRLSRK